MKRCTRTVVLHPEQSEVRLSEIEEGIAISVAHRLAMSPHEWTWTPDEQAKMAAYVLWAHQRLCGIAQLASGELRK